MHWVIASMLAASTIKEAVVNPAGMLAVAGLWISRLGFPADSVHGRCGILARQCVSGLG
jgi:hypothetical protein